MIESFQRAESIVVFKKSPPSRFDRLDMNILGDEAHSRGLAVAVNVPPVWNKLLTSKETRCKGLSYCPCAHHHHF